MMVQTGNKSGKSSDGFRGAGCGVNTSFAEIGREGGGGRGLEVGYATMDDVSSNGKGLTAFFGTRQLKQSNTISRYFGTWVVLNSLYSCTNDWQSQNFHQNKNVREEEEEEDI